MKHTGPLLGYNNNIPYKGQVFHVQTEDSGSKRPHVFTHLFADGGRIVKTLKTSYAHFIGKDNITDRVRGLMRDQHKAMVIALRDGELDVLIDEGRAEIEEREAPATVPPPAAEEGEETSRPSRPLDLLERAASVDDRDFIREIEQLVPEKRPSGDRNAGTYSFVGASKPPAGSSPPRVSPPPRRMRSTRPPLDSGPEPEPPPAVDVAARRRPPPPGPPPVPHPRAPRPSGAWAFGSTLKPQRRLDEAIRAYFGKR
ncbi:MAG: hypothetical protein R3B72_42365 [Polyangiaceae bacterium]